MHFLKNLLLIIFLLQISCAAGGPLTPLKSFNAIKSAVEKNDSEAIAGYLTESSLNKISKLAMMIKDMRNDQLANLSCEYGYSEDKLKNLKVLDCVSLYFFSDTAGVQLGRYFKERIISIDIHGSRALVKVESGIELDFVREGPYWKFDISDL